MQLPGQVTGMDARHWGYAPDLTVPVSISVKISLKYNVEGIS